MNRKPARLLTALDTGVLIGDGAIGTLLYEQGIPLGICYEELNLTQASIIQEIHRRHLHAGAEVFETNTFHANRYSLSKFGLEKQVKRINQAAVENVRSAVGAAPYVVGAVGSIQGGKQEIEGAELRDAFREQIESLLESGVDGILFETFLEYAEMVVAIEETRKLSTSVPVIAQFAMSDTGRTQDGISATDVFRKLIAMGADVVGFNCRSGPSGVLRNLERVRGDFRLSAFPNAGLPDYVDGQYIFPSSIDYFAKLGVQMVEAGVRLIGGCCGTTPDHIRALAAALQEARSNGEGSLLQGHGSSVLPSAVSNHSTNGNGSIAESIEIREPSFVKELEEEYRTPITVRVKTKQTLLVELDPPRDLQIGKFMEGAHCLKEAGAAAISMAENSLASTRMSNLSLSYLVQEHVGITAIPHVTCRDRNLIAQQSHLMGLHTLGIRHVLAVTGDPTRFGDTPGASSVYDMTSFDMIRMIRQFNDGQSYTGRNLKGNTQFTIACALNPNVRHLDQVVKRLEKKLEAGAHFVMTQPIYDSSLFESLYQATKQFNVPIFVGIAPLSSYKNALFVHNEVPGYRLPDNVLNRMSKYEGLDAQKEGMEIAKELIAEAVRYFPGLFLITPFLRYEMTAELTRFAKQCGQREGIA